MDLECSIDKDNNTIQHNNSYNEDSISGNKN